MNHTAQINTHTYQSEIAEGVNGSGNTIWIIQANRDSDNKPFSDSFTTEAEARLYQSACYPKG